jgi:hypothetical protein
MDASELHLRQLSAQLRHLAPMAVRALIARELEGWPEGASRDAWAELAARLTPLDTSPVRGRAWFPVLRHDGPLEGHLAAVTTRVSGLDADDHPLVAAGAARARAWLAAFLAGATGTELGRFASRLEDVRLDLALHRPDAEQLRIARDEALAREVRGRSLELACLVALVSELVGVAPREAVVLSGAAPDEGAPDEGPEDIAPVAGCEAKARVSALEAPEAAVVLVDARLPLGPLLVRLFGADVVGALSRACGESPHALLGRAAAAWRMRDHAEAARLAQLALDGATDPEDQLAGRLYLGTQRLHRGELEAGRALLDEAVLLGEALAARGETRHLSLLGSARIFLAVSALDALRPGLAMSHLEALEAELSATPARFRDDTWFQQMTSCLGTMDRAARGLGALAKASALRSRALALGGPSQRARNLLELARLAAARGDIAEARARLGAAEAALADNGFLADRQRTERFIRLTWRSAGLAPAPGAAEVSEAARTAPDLRRWPQPAELAEVLLASSGPRSELLGWLERHWTPAAPALPPTHPAFLQLGVTLCARAVASGTPHEAAFRALAATLIARLPPSAEDALVDPLRAFASGGPPGLAIAVALY